MTRSIASPSWSRRSSDSTRSLHVARGTLSVTPRVSTVFARVRTLQRTTPVPSPRSQDPRIPDDLEEMVRRATAKPLEERFQSCEEILRVLSEVHEVETGPLGLAVKTVPFIYKPSLEATVSHLIEDLTDRAEDIEGLDIR